MPVKEIGKYHKKEYMINNIIEYLLELYEIEKECSKFYFENQIASKYRKKENIDTLKEKFDDLSIKYELLEEKGGKIDLVIEGNLVQVKSATENNGKFKTRLQRIGAK